MDHNTPTTPASSNRQIHPGSVQNTSNASMLGMASVRWQRPQHGRIMARLLLLFLENFSSL